MFAIAKGTKLLFVSKMHKINSAQSMTGSTNESLFKILYEK